MCVVCDTCYASLVLTVVATQIVGVGNSGGEAEEVEVGEDDRSPLFLLQQNLMLNLMLTR